jgi:signal transduction histidine kinase/DNA-binding response OmpR family regulator
MAKADKANILVVDDLPEKLLVLESVLEELGQNVIAVRSGAEALRQVLQREFAVILLDVNMPGMNGLETAALIRARKKSAHTPIIFITAFVDELHTAEGYSLGAVDYILSPIVPEILRTKVRVFVDLYRMTEQTKRQADERVALVREQMARAAAEEATRRSAFLAEASKVLASSLDYDTTLRGLLRLAVPYLADLGAITLMDEHGEMRQTELAWVQSAASPCEYTVAAKDSLNPQFVETIRRVLASGEPEYTTEDTPGWPAAQAWTAITLKCTDSRPLPDFRLGSVMVLPLLARDKALGALTLATAHSGHHYTPADLALAQDLTNRAAIAIDNARLYRDIQQADRQKNEFLSMLAHELRNPLAPICNGLQILRLRAGDQADQGRVRDIIERQVQQLVRLVDDLLDISRITQGKIRLQTEAVDLATVVSRAIETSHPLIDARRHELTVSLPPQPVRVIADPVRLAQVVGNLLHNAAKYTEEGGRIWLTVEQTGNEVAVSVRDTGVGIPAEMLSSIFDLFTQASCSLDRSQGGLGIGLTLVRRLVEMHGGRVQALSGGPNKGSEFVVHLPVLIEEEIGRVSANGSASPGAKCPRRRILVVDDNQDVAESLALLLRETGQDVQAAYDGPSALATAENYHPEIVFLDIGLPGMDGYEVARRLRAQTGTAHALLVALSGYGQTEDVRRSREVGFDHHLVKPTDPKTLTGLLASFSPESPV